MPRTQTRRGRTFKTAARRVMRIVGLAVLAVLVAMAAIVLVYRFVNPPVSTLMLADRIAGTPYRQTWVTFDQISPHVVKAVVMNEDGGFCRHWGVDWRQVRNALRAPGPSRGASTIPMQTAKNLFLWPQRSYVRKVAEVPLAYIMTALWPARRQIEVYLNIIEWGDGIYGVEAASQKYFHRSAARLTAAQGAALAAIVPNPDARSAVRPGPRTRALAGVIARRAANSDPWLACIYPH